MRKKLLATLLVFTMTATVLGGCGQKATEVSGNAVEGSTEETTPTSQEESTQASDAESGAPTEPGEETSTETGEEGFSKQITYTFPDSYPSKGYTLKLVYANDPDMSLNYTHIETPSAGNINFSWKGPTVLGEFVFPVEGHENTVLLCDKDRRYFIHYWLASKDFGDYSLLEYDKETLIHAISYPPSDDYFDTYEDDEMERVIWSINDDDDTPILGYVCFILDKKDKSCRAFVCYSHPDDYDDAMALELVESIAIDHPVE